MAQNTPRIGWIGMGRMGYPMAERLLKAGYDVSIWNRTRSKAEPLAKIGGKIVSKLSERRAEMMDMRPSGVGRTRLVFHAPTRGLIGYQGELLSDTRGTARVAA